MDISLLIEVKKVKNHKVNPSNIVCIIGQVYISLPKKYKKEDNMKENDQMQNRLELARAYIKIQELNEIYNLREALEKGTLFPELYRPYEIRSESFGGAYYG